MVQLWQTRPTRRNFELHCFNLDECEHTLVQRGEVFSHNVFRFRLIYIIAEMTFI